MMVCVVRVVTMVRDFTVVRVVRDICVLCNSLLTIGRDGII